MADHRPPFEHGSPFFRVPLEIRHYIYRFLLLDPPESYLRTPWYQQDALEKVEDAHKSIWAHGPDQDINARRFPAILRTNRQIYGEASALLYSELNMHLQCTDFSCPSDWTFEEATGKLWIYNPFDGTGTTDSSGLTVYAKPELKGVMEPHVLTQFKKITCVLNFYRVHQVPVHDFHWFFFGEQYIADADDEADLIKCFRESVIIDELFRFLSLFPNIYRLDVPLAVAVKACDGVPVLRSQILNAIATDYRIMELFLDSGVLAQLQNLSNVKSFNCDYAPRVPNILHQEPYKPILKLNRTLLDLKQKIEQNYAPSKG